MKKWGSNGKGKSAKVQKTLPAKLMKMTKTLHIYPNIYLSSIIRAPKELYNKSSKGARYVWYYT